MAHKIFNICKVVFLAFLLVLSVLTFGSASWWLKLFYILAYFVALVKIYDLLTRKYVSPFTLDIYFGRKGCGKSSTLQKLAKKYHKLGWHVFCDEGNTMQTFVTPIQCSKLWQYKLPEYSVVLIDEINLLWDNRDFKSFPKPLQKYLRLQRHKKIKLIMFSQTFDCDSKIRNLADTLYLCNKFLRVFTICTAYFKRPTILTALETRQEGRITDDFRKLPFWNNQITFIPNYVKSYDSFSDDQEDYVYDLSLFQ